MQAPTASNETRLPRAIVRQMQALQPSVPESVVPPADTTLPASPSAAPADPAGTAVPPAPVAAPAPADPRHNDPNYWRQRFQVTEGYLRQERADRDAGEQTLHQRIAELQQEIARLQSSAPSAPIDPKQLLTEDQIAALGEDEAQAVATAAFKAAQQAVEGALKTHVQPLQAQREGDQQAAQRRTKGDFLTQLTALEPGWQETDKLPGWHQWLAEPDATTGMARQEILDRHLGRYNAAGVAAMVRAFNATQAPAAQPPMPPHGSGALPDGDLPPADPAAMRPPTPTEIKDFYRRSTLGRVSADERTAFDRRLRLRNG